jgi:hypothetical protein
MSVKRYIVVFAIKAITVKYTDTCILALEVTREAMTFTTNLSSVTQANVLCLSVLEDSGWVIQTTTNPATIMARLCYCYAEENLKLIGRY